jgi:hypothetical protein
MLGAIAGDIIGSVHEFGATKTTDFPLFVAQSFDGVYEGRREPYNS